MFEDLSFRYFYDSPVAALLLGAVLARPAAFPSLSPLLSPDDFEPVSHRLIWQAFLELAGRSHPITPESVAALLAGRPAFDASGGLPALCDLAAAVPACPPDLTASISRLRSLSARRGVYNLWLALHAPASDPSLTAAAAHAAMLRQLAAFAPSPAGAPRASLNAPISADLLAARRFNGPVWLLDRLFLQGALNLLAGEITSGKTFLALDLAISIAAGLPAWDNRPCAAGPVLYFCQDTGPRTIQRRLLALCAGRGLSPPPALIFDFSFMRLASADGLEYLADQVARHRAVLVIFDALARYLPGADENSAATVSPVLTGLRLVATRSGAAILIIHHFNKAIFTSPTPTGRMGRVRGSSDIAAAVDAALSVTLLGTRRQSTRLITPEKNRELPEEPAFEFNILPQPPDGLILRFTSAEQIASPEAAALAAAVSILRAAPDQPFTRLALQTALAAAGHTPSLFLLNRLFAALPSTPGIHVSRLGRSKLYTAAPPA